MMTNFLKHVALLSIVLIFSGIGCTKPMDKKITKENYPKLLDEIRKSASPEEWEKVNSITMMAKMAGLAGKTETEVLEGKSFNEIIANIGKQKEAELKAAKEEDEKAEQLSQLFEVVQWTKGNKADSYGINKSIILSIEVRNKMDKEMDAFEGTIFVYDKLQNQLGAFRIKETDTLGAGASRKLSYDISTIDFKNKVEEIYSTKGKDLRFKFQPTKVLLKDGTTL